MIIFKKSSRDQFLPHCESENIPVAIATIDKKSGRRKLDFAFQTFTKVINRFGIIVSVCNYYDEKDEHICELKIKCEQTTGKNWNREFYLF